jgi:hypothetical protein
MHPFRDQQILPLQALNQQRVRRQKGKKKENRSEKEEKMSSPILKRLASSGIKQRAMSGDASGPTSGPTSPASPVRAPSRLTSFAGTNNASMRGIAAQPGTAVHRAQRAIQALPSRVVTEDESTLESRLIHQVERLEAAGLGPTKEVEVLERRARKLIVAEEATAVLTLELQAEATAALSQAAGEAMRAGRAFAIDIQQHLERWLRECIAAEEDRIFRRELNAFLFRRDKMVIREASATQRQALWHDYIVGLEGIQRAARLSAHFNSLAAIGTRTMERLGRAVITGAANTAAEAAHRAHIEGAARIQGAAILARELRDGLMPRVRNAMRMARAAIMREQQRAYLALQLANLVREEQFHRTLIQRKQLLLRAQLRRLEKSGLRKAAKCSYWLMRYVTPIYRGYNMDVPRVLDLPHYVDHRVEQQRARELRQAATPMPRMLAVAERTATDFEASLQQLSPTQQRRLRLADTPSPAARRITTRPQLLSAVAASDPDVEMRMSPGVPLHSPVARPGPRSPASYGRKPLTPLAAAHGGFSNAAPGSPTNSLRSGPVGAAGAGLRRAYGSGHISAAVGDILNNTPASPIRPGSAFRH